MEEWKMKKNKLLFFVAMFTITVLFLAACGNGDNSEVDETQDVELPTTDIDSDDSGSELSGDIIFSWWGDDPRHEATKEIIDLFVSENPGVTITPRYGVWNGFQDQFAGDLDANMEADLMQVNFNWLALYSPMGDTFLDLETVSDYLNLSNWSTEDLNVTRVNGVLQAVPSGMTARVPFMRTDIYEAAGLDINDINTWEDLMEAGRIIRDELGEDYYALSPLGRASLAYVVFSWLEQSTGKPFVDENNQFNYTLEELTAGIQLIEDMVENNVLALPGSDNINSTNPRWISGHYGAVSEWDSSINNWINNLDDGEDIIAVREHFIMDDALSSGWMSRPSMAFAISRNSEYPEVAAAFLNFMLTDERAVAILGTDRGVPANAEGLRHFEALVAEGEIGGAAVEANRMHSNADTTIMSPVFEFPEVREVYELQLELVQTGEATVAEAAEFIYENVQAVIDSLVQ
jgi:oligogalacturonide transport system substrate-binding protein